MGVPAKKVFLHVGLHKTGTTFLQNVFKANGARLLEQGIDFPHRPDDPVQSHAVWDLRGRRPRGTKDPRVAGAWQALVDRVDASDAATFLISEEGLSTATLNQARRAIEPFLGSEVHIIVTVRDLARVVVSSWQEDVKNGATDTWKAYVDALRDPERAAASPARGFWSRHDLIRILETWEAALPQSPHHIHLVTVPRSSSDPDALTRRFGSVVGFDAATLTEPPLWTNESVGVAGIEVVRRVNERIDGRLNQVQQDWLVKRNLVRLLARRTQPVRFGLPVEEMPWVTERASGWIASIEGRGYDVVGDLGDLVPRPEPSMRRPDEVSESELLEASLDALAMISEEYARKWWTRRRQRLDEVEEKRDLTSQARALVFKGQMRFAHLADKTAIGTKAMDAVLRSRRRAIRKARQKED